MAKTTLFNAQGKAVSEIELSDAVFGVALKNHVVHEAYVAQLANSRVGLAHTKTRGDVRGGGKKPWKQKGTGRARHGSSRSPIWVGGGVTFGPRSDRDFTIKVNPPHNTFHSILLVAGTPRHVITPPLAGPGHTRPGLPSSRTSISK